MDKKRLESRGYSKHSIYCYYSTALRFICSGRKPVFNHSGGPEWNFLALLFSFFPFQPYDTLHQHAMLLAECALVVVAVDLFIEDGCCLPLCCW